MWRSVAPAVRAQRRRRLGRRPGGPGGKFCLDRCHLGLCQRGAGRHFKLRQHQRPGPGRRPLYRPERCRGAQHVERCLLQLCLDQQQEHLRGLHYKLNTELEDTQNPTTGDPLTRNGSLSFLMCHDGNVAVPPGLSAASRAGRDRAPPVCRAWAGPCSRGRLASWRGSSPRRLAVRPSSQRLQSYCWNEGWSTKRYHE